MKIRWSSLLFGSFAHHFQIKLSTHGSTLNSIFVIMSELECFKVILSTGRASCDFKKTGSDGWFVVKQVCCALLLSVLKKFSC
jgi:hypothetical protein